jgi:hypothetical protein
MISRVTSQFSGPAITPIDAPSFPHRARALFARHPILVTIALAWCLWSTYRSTWLRAGLTILNAQADSAAASCVYLVSSSGQAFELAYDGRICRRNGYLPLPPELYANVDSWTTNAYSAGILSDFDAYRIRARLATTDRSCQPLKFFSAHGGFNFTRFCAWADHLQDISYTVARLHDRIPSAATSFEQRVSRAGLGSRDRTVITVRSKPIGARARRGLVAILARTEAQLDSFPALHVAARSFDDAVNAVAGHEQARRGNFGQYRVR